MFPYTDEYLWWLHDRVLSNSSRIELFRVLYLVEFEWGTNRGDQNRAEYGILLRSMFIENLGVPSCDIFLAEPCSALETLVAFADLCEFESGVSRCWWFDRFVVNLGVDFSDDECDPMVVSSAVNMFVTREYSPNGMLLPVRCDMDMRNEELYKQFCIFASENGL